MARQPPGQQTLRPSVFDRLIDDDPHVTREPPAAAHEVLPRIVAAVRRDLEWLLNTRLTWLDEDLLAFEELKTSIATYGLPDFSHESLRSTQSLERLKRTIEQAIATFEPRLTRVTVTPRPPDEHSRALRFRIDAVLRIEPIREPVSFDTELEPTGYAKVQEG